MREEKKPPTHTHTRKGKKKLKTKNHNKLFSCQWVPLIAQLVKNLPAMQETPV